MGACCDTEKTQTEPLPTCYVADTTAATVAADAESLRATQADAALTTVKAGRSRKRAASGSDESPSDSAAASQVRVARCPIP